MFLVSVRGYSARFFFFSNTDFAKSTLQKNEKDAKNKKNVSKICRYQRKAVILQRKQQLKHNTTMRTYFINKINNITVSETVTSIDEMETLVLKYSFKYGFGTRKIYVRCSHICSGTTDEQNVEYIVFVNDNTMYTRRVK